MKTNEEHITPIAELLPEGLSESAVNEIAHLVNTVITEQVQEKVRQLESKVKGFIRLKIDDLKDQAMRELQEEEELVKNNELFKSIKTLMALELKSDDEENAISELVQQQTEFEAEIEVLTDELKKSFEENDKMENTLKAVADKVANLEEDKNTLLEAVDVLEDSKELPFKSSEKAVIITEDVDQVPEEDTLDIIDNNFLTPEVMKFMPSNPNS